MAHRIIIKDLLPWIAAVAGGILAFLGYAGFDHFYLEWICLVPILWAIREQNPVRAFFIGWVAGITMHGGGFYWIIYMFEQFAGLSWPPALLGLLLLAAANGIVLAIWAGATRFITRGTGWSVIWVSPIVWTALEKFWPEIFPNYLGASQYKLTLLTQIADVTGILGVTFLVVYVNSLIYAVIERWMEKKPFPFRPVAVFAAAIALVLVYGAVRIYSVDKSASAAEKLTIVEPDRNTRTATVFFTNIRKCPKNSLPKTHSTSSYGPKASQRSTSARRCVMGGFRPMRLAISVYPYCLARF
jgi:apolipoprotein N-acyltransferase